MPRGRPRKPRLSRMDAAIDAMFQLGYSEEKVRAHVKQLLKEYGGDEGWPFIEEGSYRELIESFLREEERDAQVQVARCGNQSKDKSCGDESIVAGTSRRASDTQPEKGSSGAVAVPTGIHADEADGNRWKDINEDPLTNSDSPKTSRITSSPSLDTPPCLQPSNSQRCRPPCNGWIESDEDQSFGQIKDAANPATKTDKDPRTNTYPPRTTRIPDSHLLTKTPPPQTTTQKRLPCCGWIESDEEDGGFVFLEPQRGELSKRMSDITKSKIRRRSRWDERPDDPR